MNVLTRRITARKDWLITGLTTRLTGRRDSHTVAPITPPSAGRSWHGSAPAPLRNKSSRHDWTTQPASADHAFNGRASPPSSHNRPLRSSAAQSVPSSCRRGRIAITAATDRSSSGSAASLITERTVIFHAHHKCRGRYENWVAQPIAAAPYGLDVGFAAGRLSQLFT